MKKFLALLLSAIMLVMCFASCSKTDNGGWDAIKEKGTLIVGLDDTFVPMGFRDETNALVGFDIDLANAVGEYLGVKVEFKSIDWNAKELELSSKRIDCIWNGMSATPARQESMSLTNKYLNNKIVIMTLNEALVNVTESSDLSKYKIGVQADSAALEAMQADANYESYKANVQEYDTYDEAILDMQAGRLQCIVVDEVLGEYKNNTLGNVFKTCTFDFGPDYYAVGCRKEEPDTAKAITDAIAELIKNGKAAEISEKWFGTNLVINEGY